MNFEYAIGATPLDPNEIAGLLPAHLSTQAVNLAEQNNPRKKYIETLRLADGPDYRPLLKFVRS